MRPFLVTIPHAGEKIPQEVTWLKGLPEEISMCDVDRYVDLLYLPALTDLKIDHVIAEWHRYVVDLNRLADDVDEDSVRGHKNPSGSFTTGLLWVKTTTGVVLLKEPISPELHQKLVEKYFQPFHRQIESVYRRLRDAGAESIYHLDAHSMPTMGTSAHRDPGQKRAEVVVSDCNGVSCRQEFRDLVGTAYRNAGFEVAYNWPYMGGRLTQQYGQPANGQHAIQVELRRDLYMDETSKKWLPSAEALKPRLRQALAEIADGLGRL